MHRSDVQRWASYTPVQWHWRTLWRTNVSWRSVEMQASVVGIGNSIWRCGRVLLQLLVLLLLLLLLRLLLLLLYNLWREMPLRRERYG